MGDSPFGLVLDAGAMLAEGPVWDDRTETLLWVDILDGAVHRLDPVTGRDEVALVGTPVGAAALTESGRLVLAVEAGFAEPGPEGTADLFAPVEADRADHRMNDGKCDAAGRMWAGTNSYDFVPGESTLWRLDPDGSVTAVLDGMTLCNGLGWSPDNSTMYVIDSLRLRLDAYDFDVDTGELAGGRTLITFADDGSLPDGMTVDAQGGLWVAMYAGAAVHRYSPDGQLDEVLAAPTAQPTCPTFGGPDLDQLYLTTAAQALSPAQLAGDPLAGGIFRADVGVRGLPAGRFGR